MRMHSAKLYSDVYTVKRIHKIYIHIHHCRSNTGARERMRGKAVSGQQTKELQIKNK